MDVVALPRRELFGLRFVDARVMRDVVDALMAGQGGDPHVDADAPLVFTPNVDLLVNLHKSDWPIATQLMRRAEYVLADGQPVVWASRLLGSPLQRRLPGSTLVAELWPRLIADERSVLVIASSETLATKIRCEYPGARVVVPPYFANEDPAATSAVAKSCFDACADGAPEFVIAGLSFPKQYTLLDELIRDWPGPSTPRMFLATGASFEMYYGLRRRSPDWVQRIGMEWFYRFLQEPRRLFRRYFIDDVAFVGLVWRQYRHAARTPSPAHPSMRPARPIGRVLPGPWRSRRRHAEDDELAETAN